MPEARCVVLVVDDEPTIREILRRSLTTGGYQMREAASAVEACHIFQQEEIDAVILDLRMPDLSGFNLLGWLRTEPIERAQTVPVFILTGYALTDAEKETIRCHHAEVFFKPHGMRQLLESLTRVTHAQA